MSIERFGGIRFAIAAEAARLMYEEGVKQYFTAKRMAAKRLLGRVAGKRMRFRPADLPSNGEIRDALLALAVLAEGSLRTRRLFAMRITALETMKALSPFEPRLIGSVSTGHIRRGSDIDIQVFADHEEALEQHMRGLGWVFERELATIQKFGEVREYVHFHVVDVFAVELTVYARRELRFVPRSSTDGKPIVRVKVAGLEAMLVREHGEAWAEYLDGTVCGLDEALAEQDHDNDEETERIAVGPYDALLLDGPGDERAEPAPGEADDPGEMYEPLPGFEHV